MKFLLYYFNNWILKKRFEKIKKLFILVALLWGSWSFTDSAKDYFDKGVKAYQSHNYIKAAKLLKRSCDLGSAEGCNKYY